MDRFQTILTLVTKVLINKTSCYNKFYTGILIRLNSDSEKKKKKWRCRARVGIKIMSAIELTKIRFSLKISFNVKFMAIKSAVVLISGCLRLGVYDYILTSEINLLRIISIWWLIKDLKDTNSLIFCFKNASNENFV